MNVSTIRLFVACCLVLSVYQAKHKHKRHHKHPLKKITHHAELRHSKLRHDDVAGSRRYITQAPTFRISALRERYNAPVRYEEPTLNSTRNLTENATTVITTTPITTTTAIPTTTTSLPPNTTTVSTTTVVLTTPAAPIIQQCCPYPTENQSVPQNCSQALNSPCAPRDTLQNNTEYSLPNQTIPNISMMVAAPSPAPETRPAPESGPDTSGLSIFSNSSSETRKALTRYLNNDEDEVLFVPKHPYYENETLNIQRHDVANVTNSTVALDGHAPVVLNGTETTNYTLSLPSVPLATTGSNTSSLANNTFIAPNVLLIPVNHTAPQAPAQPHPVAVNPPPQPSAVNQSNVAAPPTEQSNQANATHVTPVEKAPYAVFPVNQSLAATSPIQNSVPNAFETPLGNSDPVSREEVARNHTSQSQFSGTVTRFENVPGGDGKSVNGTLNVGFMNRSDDFRVGEKCYNLCNTTKTVNATGVYNVTDQTSEFLKNRNKPPPPAIQKKTYQRPTKRCKTSTSHHKPLDMVENPLEDYDVAGADINCVTGDARRLVTTRKTKKHSSKTNKTTSTTTKEAEKTPATDNTGGGVDYSERQKALELTKYKILNGIHDNVPPPEDVTTDDRYFTNKSIPADPTLVQQVEERIHESTKDSSVGIMGIDDHPAIDLPPMNNTLNITANNKNNNTNKNITSMKDENKKASEHEIEFKKFKEDEAKVDKTQKWKVKDQQKLVNKTDTDQAKKPALSPVNATLSNKTSEETTKQNSTRSTAGKGREKRVLCFGDSLTRGFYNKGKSYHPYSIRLKELLEEGDKNTTYEMINSGVNGECAIKEMERRLPRLLDAEAPLDLVIILAGTNDLLGRCDKTVDLFRAVQGLHESVLARNWKTVVVTVPEVHVYRENLRENQQLEEILTELNQKLRMYVNINVHPDRVFLSDLADEFSRQKSPASEKVSDLWDDKIHPTPKGYDRIGEIIYNDIKGRF